MAKPLFAILLDGGFVTKRLYVKLGRKHATADDIIAECDRLKSLPEVAEYELLRIYYYDAPPSAESVAYPISGKKLDLAATTRYTLSQALHDQLVMQRNVAVRMGRVALLPNKWRIKPRVANELKKEPRPLTDNDFTLDTEQKGVDMRVGLDIARLALREMVRSVIVVTGDSDFVPAFKFARWEGVKVILA